MKNEWRRKFVPIWHWSTCLLALHCIDRPTKPTFKSRIDKFLSSSISLFLIGSNTPSIFYRLDRSEISSHSLFCNQRSTKIRNFIFFIRRFSSFQHGLREQRPTDSGWNRVYLIVGLICQSLTSFSFSRLVVTHEKAKEYLTKISHGIEQHLTFWQSRRAAIAEQMNSHSIDFLLNKTQRINELTIDAVQSKNSQSLSRHWPIFVLIIL